MDLCLDESPFRTAKPFLDGQGRYQPVSYWQETVAVTPGEPLSENISCDVAIVGGGFTGLSVAYHLKQHAPDLDVVLLERAVIGHGASGRNGGFSMPLLGWDLYSTAQAVGEAQAKHAYEVMYRAVAHFKELIHRHEIPCDLEETGYLLIATCEARERHNRAEYELAHRMGFDHQWLDKKALEDYIRSASFRSAVFDPHPCIVNPAKLARGLKSVVESMGVRIYERSPLYELRDGKPLTLRAGNGAVKATQVVLALNGYGAAVGFKPAQILPVHTFIVLTEPLTQAQLEEIGWAKYRASLETARNFIHYFRLTADNRIAFGGEDAQLYYGGRYQDHDERICSALKARFREYFPSLAHVRFTHEWGGQLGVTLEMFPTFGITGDHKSIFYACGYSGHGVSLSNYAGALLAPVMLRAAGRREALPADDLPFFWQFEPMRIPPDPLRYIGLQAYRWALRIQDKIEGA